MPLVTKAGIKLSSRGLVTGFGMLAVLAVFVLFALTPWIQKLYSSPLTDVGMPSILAPAERNVNRTSETSQSSSTNFNSQITTLSTAATRDIRHCEHLPTAFKSNASLFHCDWYTKQQPENCDERLRAILSCNTSSVDILWEWVSIDTSPAIYDFEDMCLVKVIERRCNDGKVIPKVMHFVSFNRRELPFYAFVSVMSAVRFVQPCLILFHSDYLPFGRYWDILVSLVPNILHVKRSIPRSIFGNVINVIQHSADVARLEAILKFGGVYMDLDHILLKPQDDLRNYSVVMGTEVPDVGYGNGMFMGKPGAKFLETWYSSYNTFNDNNWAYHSTQVPVNIHRSHPELELHIEDSFFKPHYDDIVKQFYTNKYNWTNLYGMHLYNYRGRDFLVGRFETQDSSLGEVTRHILYGNRLMCFGSNNETEPVRMVGMQETKMAFHDKISV